MKWFKNKRLLRLVTGKRNASRYNQRVVRIGNKVGVEVGTTGPQGEETQTVFADNYIRTSKYTWISIVPKNLFQQFRRIANFYFLIIGGLQLVIDSPVSPFTSIAPLVFVVTTTFAKQAYEDWLRHKADRAINDRKIKKVAEEGGLTDITAKKIEVGDILCIYDGEEFPADMVILSSSSPQGKANIMTANLDGETNLKVHSATQATRQNNTPAALDGIVGLIQCEGPNANLTNFVGNLKVFNQPDENGRSSSRSKTNTVALGQENVALRGAKLKNTEFMYGCAIYTGEDTKMSRNSRMTTNKFSTAEITMNKYLIFFMILLFLEMFMATTLKYTIAFDRPSIELVDIPWYLGQGTTTKQLLQDVVSFLVLFNYIIPISLYVTLEVQKFVGAFFFVWDVELYDEEQDMPAKCNSSDLNEELGQVEYLFSDKTGTLTRNVMEFKECSIDGVKFFDRGGNLVYEENGDGVDRIDGGGENEYIPDERTVRRFLEVLALCHTVEATEQEGTGRITYSAASPDEKALVEACSNYGVVFSGEKEDENGNTFLEISINTAADCSIHQRYYRLHVLDFDSDRKCMSVIMREENGGIFLFSKGAESSIFPKCHQNQLLEDTSNDINDYALVGLRTLAVASKKMSEEDYLQFMAAYNEASQAMTNREKKVKGVYSSLESNLNLLGAIAVEDKLQEDVKETLVRLEAAGIKVWVLTGDKKETAINISFSCGHFQRDMQIVDIANNDANTVGSALEAGLAKSGSDASKKYCLVVDGGTLVSVFAYEDNLCAFRELTSRCCAVICCRMSPLQKSEIVAMIKKSPNSPVTAAVGDGANDVSMIQEAHVGLGIAGKEGRAAVRSADFAFGKFKHLQRVLLVHGHWYYYRVAILIQYFFYKNVAGFTAQLFFAFFNQYSTETLYDSVSLTMFNIVYTSLPVFILGIFEQNIDSDRLLRNPSLYNKIAKNKLLSVPEFLIWLALAFWHSIVTFFGFYAFYHGYLNNTSADTLGKEAFGVAIYQSVVIVVNLKLLLTSRYWNALLVGSVVLSLISFLVVTMIYQVIPDFGSTRVIFNLLGSPGVWLTLFWVVIVSLLPDITLAALRKGRKGFEEFLERRNNKSPLQYTVEYDYDNKGYVGSVENL